jgi:hypothetical protein
MAWLGIGGRPPGLGIAIANNSGIIDGIINGPGRDRRLRAGLGIAIANNNGIGLIKQTQRLAV